MQDLGCHDEAGDPLGLPGWFTLRSSVLKSRKEVASGNGLSSLSLVPLKAFAGSYVGVSMEMIPLWPRQHQLSFSCFFPPSFLYVLQRGVKKKVISHPPSQKPGTVKPSLALPSY